MLLNLLNTQSKSNVTISKSILVCSTASEVFEMNHEATRLTEQLTALRKNSQMLSDSLTQLQQEVLTKKKQEEKEKLEKVSVLTEAISTVQNELDVSASDIFSIVSFLSHREGRE